MHDGHWPYVAVRLMRVKRWRMAPGGKKCGEGQRKALGGEKWRVAPGGLILRYSTFRYGDIVVSCEEESS
eukprot:6200503-Pleurochrysis_carterae.AAC.3